MLSITVMGTTYHQSRRTELMRAFRPNRITTTSRMS